MSRGEIIAFLVCGGIICVACGKPLARLHLRSILAELVKRLRFL